MTEKIRKTPGVLGHAELIEPIFSRIGACNGAPFKVSTAKPIRLRRFAGRKARSSSLSVWVRSIETWDFPAPRSYFSVRLQPMREIARMRRTESAAPPMSRLGCSFIAVSAVIACEGRSIRITVWACHRPRSELERRALNAPPLILSECGQQMPNLSVLSDQIPSRPPSCKQSTRRPLDAICALAKVCLGLSLFCEPASLVTAFLAAANLMIEARTSTPRLSRA